VAIKGKSKPRARRSVTPGPRPVYVPVKRPLLQRRGFQIGLVVFVVVAAAAAIAYGLIHEHDQNRQKALAATMRAIASDYSVKVQGAIGGLGQTQAGGAFTLLPQVASDLKGLGSGSVKPAAAAADAKTYGKQASDGADTLHTIDPATMVSGKGVEDAAFVRDLLNGRFKMEEGLRMAAQASTLLGQAAAAGTNAERTMLLGDANQAFQVAQTVFADGYTDWINAQVTAGVYVAPGFGANGSPVTGS